MIAFRVFALLLGLVTAARAVEAPELLLHDIGPFNWIGRPQDAERGDTGLLTGSGRLGSSEDRTRNTRYTDRSREFFVGVTVSRYADPTWVLHQFENTYRSPAGTRATEIVGAPGSRRFQYAVRGLKSSTVLVAWISGEATLIAIQATVGGEDRAPEIPVEVVDAYLGLYPSTLPESIDDSPEHHTQWVRDEIRRVLEYAPRDLEFARNVPADSPQAYRRDTFRDYVIRWLTRFAELRERFYGAGSANELKEELLRAQLTDIDPDTQELDVNKHLDRLEAKLTEFQGWWAAHQNDPVQLPTPPATAAPPPAETPASEP